MAVEADILATSHALALGLREVGVITESVMREIEELCVVPGPSYDGYDVHRIRTATRMSARAFARLLGLDESAVDALEGGARPPTGPEARLLELLDRERPDSPVVKVRQAVMETAV